MKNWIRGLLNEKVCFYKWIKNHITMTKSLGGVFEVKGRCSLQVMTHVLTK